MGSAVSEWQRRRDARSDGQCLFEAFLRASGRSVHDIWARYAGVDDVHDRWIAFAATMPAEVIAAVRAYPEVPDGERFKIASEDIVPSMVSSLLRLRGREMSEAVTVINALLHEPGPEAWEMARGWIEHRSTSEPDLTDREPIAELTLVKSPADGWQVSNADPANFPTLTFARALVYPLEEVAAREAG